MGLKAGTELIIIDRNDNTQACKVEVGPWDEHGQPNTVMEVPFLML
jgi:hypothetical protein